jgi:hypothetical protein
VLVQNQEVHCTQDQHICCCTYGCSPCRCCASSCLQRGIALLGPDLQGAPATVLGDPSRICGILLNLYTNAGQWGGHDQGCASQQCVVWHCCGACSCGGV